MICNKCNESTDMLCDNGLCEECETKRLTNHAHTPGPWHWHDTFGRKDGHGEPIGIGRGITGDYPDVGNCSRFSFAVSDDQGFCVAHCTGSLVTMSSERSEANARLIAAAPELLEACKEVLSQFDDAVYICGKDDEPKCQQTILKLRKAIAKTEGQK